MLEVTVSGKRLGRIILTGLVLVFCSSWFYFLYNAGRVEIVYSYLYYLPIVVAAFFYGIGGGLFVALFCGLAYTVFVSASGVEFYVVDLVPGIGSFILVGLLTGLMNSHLVHTREDLEEKVNQLYTSSKISNTVSSSLKLSEVLQNVVEEATEALSCEVGSILLLHPLSDIMTIHASWGLDKEVVKKTKVKIGERISGWVVQYGKPLLVEDIEKDPRFKMRSSERYYTKSLLSVPLKARGETIGVINVNNKRGRRKFTESDLSLLTAIASEVSVGVHNARLFEEVNQSYMNSIKALTVAIDERDHYTKSHSDSVTKYALAIGEEMNLSERELHEIREAGELHDLGKIGIHDYILNKPGKLTDSEWQEVRLHSLKAAKILEPLTFLDGVIDIIRGHHERYDGKGYPNGEKGEDIHMGARILSLADAYDAMTSERPYRKAMTKEEAVEEIKRGNGTQFDPQVVEAFLKATEKKKL